MTIMASLFKIGKLKIKKGQPFGLALLIKII
jgi:hypothetical protein